MSEETYLMIAAPIGLVEKLLPFDEYRYIPIRSVDSEIGIEASMISEQHDVQIMGVISKEMIREMQVALGDHAYLMIATPIGCDIHMLPSNKYRYVPFNCDAGEIGLAVKMASEQYELQALGIISREMSLGMLKTIEDFERGV